MSKGYFNSTKRDMTMKTVVENILEFIKNNPNGEIRLIVGTDSQLIGLKTCFATGIVIHNVGKGAWCCVNKHIEIKKIGSLSEKIHMETFITYKTICTLNELVVPKAIDILLDNKNTNFKIEAHIDIGRLGATRVLIREMIGYFEGIGIEAKIKPFSFVASSYANRYSKAV